VYTLAAKSFNILDIAASTASDLGDNFSLGTLSTPYTKATIGNM
jgi:hypothetical protein